MGIGQCRVVEVIYEFRDERVSWVQWLLAPHALQEFELVKI